MAKGLNLLAAPMNRRRFLQTAAMAVAGSACGGSIISCGTQYNIPCLGPAAAPVPVAGMTYIRASEIGCALDCNLETGHNKITGGDATDDGPRINAALAEASVENPITLIIDGGALISGLFLPAAGYWSIAGLGCGTGFFIKKGTNNDGIHNGPPDAATPSDPGLPVPARGANVSLSNFTLNGNEGDGRNGDSTSGNLHGSPKLYYFGINLMSLNNITLENLVVVNTPSYLIRLSNVGNVAVSGCVLVSQQYFQDGLHFDGPANDIEISGCKFTTGDDSIALNCPEGYSGNISRVSVTNCTFNSWSLMRLYTWNGYHAFYIDTVSVSNCSGTLAEAAFLIGVTNGSNPKSVDGLNISNCNLTAPAVLGIAENFGSIVLNEVDFTPSNSNVIWVPSSHQQVCGFVRPSPLYDNTIVAGGNISFNNCTITRTSDVDVAAVIVENGSTIDEIQFNGFSVQNVKSYSSLPHLVSIATGGITQLVLNSLASDGINTPASKESLSSIDLVSGGGVLATAWEFPDTVMANEVPYISANSGLPSIKIDGVVEPYDQS